MGEQHQAKLWWDSWALACWHTPEPKHREGKSFQINFQERSIEYCPIRRVCMQYWYVRASDLPDLGNMFDKSSLKWCPRLSTYYAIKSKEYGIQQGLHLKYVHEWLSDPLSSEWFHWLVFKVIILVGGFGGNRYLLQQIEEYFCPMNIVIQQPVRSWSVVCRGAVHRGVQGGDQIVTNHISKFSYGVIYQCSWQDGKFLLADKWFDDRRQSWAAVNQMNWYLKKVSRSLKFPSSQWRTLYGWSTERTKTSCKFRKSSIHSRQCIKMKKSSSANIM